MSSAFLAISKLRRNSKFPLLTNAHIHKPLIPSLDHLSHSKFKREWLISIHTATQRQQKIKYQSPEISTAFHLHFPLHWLIPLKLVSLINTPRNISRHSSSPFPSTLALKYYCASLNTDKVVVSCSKQFGSNSSTTQQTYTLTSRCFAGVSKIQGKANVFFQVSMLLWESGVSLGTFVRLNNLKFEFKLWLGWRAFLDQSGISDKLQDSRIWDNFMTCKWFEFNQYLTSRAISTNQE